MFMLIAILVIQVDARCGVTEGVVQCRDWREFEGGTTNVLFLERVIGEIHIEDYPALTRLIIHDQQASCDNISANPWTTVRIGSRTCQNAQDFSEPKDVAMTSLRTVELAAFTFITPWIYVILGGTGVVILIFMGMMVCMVKRRCQRRRADLESQSLTEFDAVVMRDFKCDSLFLVVILTVCVKRRGREVLV
ncbi:uncharacterized protein LOC134268442 [Saccostrea cucullata]|uniref:uncharacterized protein LOC134268442 n=1 Tax=Saccostrea cuccullata TaxID=36930 RepID=UPI002ED23894